MPEPNDRDEFEDALAADVPQFYFNSFANYLSAGDIVTVLQRNGRPVAILNVSLPIAKSYSEFLASLIDSYEKAAGYTLIPGLEAGSSGEEG